MESSSENTSTPKPRKGNARARNDAKWDSFKDEIHDFYIVAGNSLSSTMEIIEQKHNFTASQRKWKMKLKEWNFEKNLSEEDKKIMIAKREKRLRDEGKETTFFHHGIIIPGSKIDSAKRKKPDQETAMISPSAETPIAITYCTPCPSRHEDEDTASTPTSNDMEPIMSISQLYSLSDVSEAVNTLAPPPAKPTTSDQPFGEASDTTTWLQKSPFSDLYIPVPPLVHERYDPSYTIF
ncbi:hypothetical protein EG329_008200 [Mollisiaceae sp. DMI_Dod_QoI]|nr:hypothetical protein EG329_008200 [Helotiales sp. DMI_Dod_QoI]